MVDVYECLQVETVLWPIPKCSFLQMKSQKSAHDFDNPPFPFSLQLLMFHLVVVLEDVTKQSLYFF